MHRDKSESCSTLFITVSFCACSIWDTVVFERMDWSAPTSLSSCWKRKAEFFSAGNHKEIRAVWLREQVVQSWTSVRLGLVRGWGGYHRGYCSAVKDVVLGLNMVHNELGRGVWMSIQTETLGKQSRWGGLMQAIR